jgi:glycogen phosphorylase
MQSTPSSARSDLGRSALVSKFRDVYERHLECTLATATGRARDLDRFSAICLTVRDELARRWLETEARQRGARRMYYLSLEYLMGRALGNALLNTGLHGAAERALAELGLSLAELEQLEADAGLGSGGLGRLAACFLDSLATLDLPGHGYGLRYDFGLFRQRIDEAGQSELVDDWLKTPFWLELARPERSVEVGFGGTVGHESNGHRGRAHWTPGERVLAVPHDTPVPGFGTRTVNTLRLFSARAADGFDFGRFGTGDHLRAHDRRLRAESITRVLYPNDATARGQELRLKQQYLLVAAALSDAISRHLEEGATLDQLPDRCVFQLNDTHPALAVPELYRLLVDVHGMDGEQAWQLTQKCLCYTNHTLLPEALEKWPRRLLSRLLPRHAELIDEIDRRFAERLRARGLDDRARLRRMAIVERGKRPQVRMAHLASIGCRAINGVAEIHSQLLKTRVLADFHELDPSKFSNKTNGITQRRWLLMANPPLAALVTEELGSSWLTNLDALRPLALRSDDAEFMQRFAEVRQLAKRRTVSALEREYGIRIDPNSLFDVQVKRIHEYKRQLLNLMHVIHLHQELLDNPDAISNPRTFLVGGKAYPSYELAKLVVKLACDVARAVNADPKTRDKLRLHFVPDYRVSVAEYLIPGADISEQISTAGFEASGTGNMKLALNGALTLGTLDGANIEIAREVGAENCFMFGLTVDEVAELRHTGHRPRDIYRADANLRRVIDLLREDFYNSNEPGLYMRIVDSLLGEDYYLVLADFDAYRRAQLEVDRAYSDRERWNRMSLQNVARVGFFSSDRTIREYSRELWQLEPRPSLANDGGGA